MDFEEIVHRYSKTIYQTAYMYVKNKETAEDITQEVFLHFYKNRQQYRGEASLKTYLTRMTYNRCYDYSKSWKNKAHQWIGKMKLKGKTAVEKDVTRNEQRTALLDAVLELAMPYREVIIFYYYNELKIREIAELLACSENTIHTRLKRAKAQLSEKLSDWEGEWHEEAAREGD